MDRVFPTINQASSYLGFKISSQHSFSQFLFLWFPINPSLLFCLFCLEQCLLPLFMPIECNRLWVGGRSSQKRPHQERELPNTGFKNKQNLQRAALFKKICIIIASTIDSDCFILLVIYHSVFIKHTSAFQEDQIFQNYYFYNFTRASSKNYITSQKIT